jgi:hypothetical protein
MPSLDTSRFEPYSSEFDEHRQALANTLNSYLGMLYDFNHNLEAQYAAEGYEAFEKQFINIRYVFNAMLSDYGNLYYQFINRSQLRQQFVKDIIEHANNAAYSFQLAREQNRLNRTESTYFVENLYFAVKNLLTVVQNPSSE